MSIETEQLLTKTIMIPTKKILDTKDINSYIEFYLKNTLEDRCDNNSYIILFTFDSTRANRYQYSI